MCLIANVKHMWFLSVFIITITSIWLYLKRYSKKYFHYGVETVLDDISPFSVTTQYGSAKPTLFRYNYRLFTFYPVEAMINDRKYPLEYYSETVRGNCIYLNGYAGNISVEVTISLEQNFKKVLGMFGTEVRKNIDIFFPKEAERISDDSAFSYYTNCIDYETFSDIIVQPIRHISDQNGKCVRSFLSLVVYLAFDSDFDKNHLDIVKEYLAYMELCHSSSLIIDDIEDNSLTRRDVPCTHLKYGTDTAINAGTFGYIMFQNLIEKIENDEKKLAVYSLYMQCLKIGHIGQGLDIKGLQHLLDMDRDPEYIEKRLENIHMLKTGVLFSFPARIMGVLSGGDEKVVEYVATFLENVGIAFQIMDDILILEGGVSKDIYEDIREGKITYPFLNAIPYLSKSDYAFIIDTMSNFSESNAEKAINLIKSTPALTICREKAKKMVQDSWINVGNHLSNSMYKEMLKRLGDFIVNR